MSKVVKSVSKVRRQQPVKASPAVLKALVKKMTKPVVKAKVSRKQSVKVSPAVPKKSAKKPVIQTRGVSLAERVQPPKKSAPKKSAPKKSVTMQRGAGKPRVTVRARQTETYRGVPLAAASFGGEAEATSRFDVELFPLSRREIIEAIPEVVPPVIQNIPAGTVFCFRNPKGSVDIGLLREEMPPDVTSLTLWLGVLPPGSVPEGQSDQVFKTIQMSQVISRAEMKD